MKTTEYITSIINRFPRGYIFTYRDFINKGNGKEAIIKAINRMAASDKIKKISKGKYYKPEKTPFGELQPEQKQIVKDLLEKNGKIFGYLTGVSIYNQLGLSTQVSSIIQIGRNEIRSTIKRGRFRITFIKQKNTITRENIPLLQILDTIRYIKKIPGTSIETSCKRILAIIKDLSANVGKILVKLALKYPPSTRVLLGAILEESGNGQLTTPLFNSLNPITKYKIPGATNALAFANRWNIK